jgi:hypothetical protein
LPATRFQRFPTDDKLPHLFFNITMDFVPDFVDIQHTWKIQRCIARNPFLTFPPHDRLPNVRAAPNFLEVFNTPEDFVPDFVEIQHTWKFQGHIARNPFLTFPPDDKLLSVHAAPIFFGDFFIIVSTLKGFCVRFCFYLFFDGYGSTQKQLPNSVHTHGNRKCKRDCTPCVSEIPQMKVF